MKWLYAKRANQLIALLSALIFAACYVAWSLLNPPTFKVNTDVEGIFQLGFYDLMSSRKEIYDTNMKTTNGTVLSTITSPDDNRFVFKGKFTQTHTRDSKFYFYLTPIYYSTPQKGLMIDGLVDLLMHTRFWMMPLEFDTPLVVGQSGSIFFYPLKE